MVNYLNIIERFISGTLAGEQIFGGSNRIFSRVWVDDKSYVILIDQNLEQLVRYSKFLQNLFRYGIPVPDVYVLDDKSCAMIMEDIGSLSLYKWSRDTGDFTPHFRAAKALAKIHSIGNIPGQLESEFDFTDLLYETQYFARHFLIGYCNFPECACDELLDEFSTIASTAADSPRGLMHRDFQSQNIFIMGEVIKIVDFQGARKGFAAYDLASLVEDPYLSLPANIREMIIETYLENSILNLTERKILIDSYPYHALQRLLQATAAYAYLSRVQGKLRFEGFIIPALQGIIRWLSGINEFPILDDVIQQSLATVRKRKTKHWRLR